MRVYTCCLCGKKFTGWGNDPWPVNTDDDVECCDKCDMEIVVPARIKGLMRKENNNAE